MREPLLVIVTGLSGSGKSTALKVLEDAGFFCIDNLPPLLLGRFVELVRAAGEEIARAAIGMDSRERRFLKDLPDALSELRRQGLEVDVCFLDASDEVLVRRFSETRRPHPLCPDGPVADGIRRERELLADLKDGASRVIDTTALNPRQLTDELRRYYSQPAQKGRVNVTIMSFGYRHGVPREADLMFDVRFLPNPFYVPRFRDRTGREEEVREYVLGWPESQEFLRRAVDLIEFLIPNYEREGKSYLTIAVGCTGGRHRSVAIARELGDRILARRLSSVGRIQLRDRDLDWPGEGTGAADKEGE